MSYRRAIKKYYQSYEKALKEWLGKPDVASSVVPESVKVEVYRRANGRCEYRSDGPKCNHPGEQFHHWKDPPTASTTALLCRIHHPTQHVMRPIYDLGGSFMRTKQIRRKRIPIRKKTRN